MQFIEKRAWVASLNVFYSLGVDGISTPLILADDVYYAAGRYRGLGHDQDRPGAVLRAFLILEGLMIGVFSALDALLFYVFWEAMLIPMFLIIGVWGGERRVYATLKFFLYTFLGSVLMLVAFIYLYGQTGSFDLFGFMDAPLTLTAQKLHLHRVPAGVRREGADVAGTHLVAGRSRGGTNRGFRDPGGNHVEDGWLRFCAPVVAHRAGRQRVLRGNDDRVVFDRGCLHRLRCT